MCAANQAALFLPKKLKTRNISNTNITRNTTIQRIITEISTHRASFIYVSEKGAQHSSAPFSHNPLSPVFYGDDRSPFIQ